MLNLYVFFILLVNIGNVHGSDDHFPCIGSGFCKLLLWPNFLPRPPHRGTVRRILVNGSPKIMHISSAAIEFELLKTKSGVFL